MIRTIFCLAFLSLISAGCAETTILPATKHAPSLADSIKFYTKPPRSYENLGLVQFAVPPGMTWDKNGNVDAGFEDFKAKAAAMGANGLLFDGTLVEGTQHLTLAGYKGQYYQVPVKQEPRTAMAKAIYVVEER